MVTKAVFKNNIKTFKMQYFTCADFIYKFVHKHKKLLSICSLQSYKLVRLQVSIPSIVVVVGVWWYYNLTSKYCSKYKSMKLLENRTRLKTTQ